MIASYFLRNPRIALLVVAMILVSSLGALLSLSRLEDPALTRRWGTVITFFPGADAERVEALVTEKIERRLLEVSEIGEIKSRSRAGVSSLEVEVDEDIPPSRVPSVWSEIRQKVDQAAVDLPDGAAAPETTWLRTGALTYVAGVAWTGEEAAPHGLLARLADELEDRLRNLPDVAETFVYGAAQEEIRVKFDPAALAAVGVTHQEAAQRLAAADPKLPAGLLRAEQADLLIDVSGEFQTLDRIRTLPLTRTEDGRFLEIGDLADVERGFREPRGSAAILNGHDAVLIGVRMDQDARVDAWITRIRGEVDLFRDSVGGAVTVSHVFDQSVYTQERLGGLLNNFVMAVVLVVIVLLVTMGVRSAVIVGASLPLTVACVLAALGVLGVPFHQMSVTGLIIALGLMIDNPIVVIDEFRHDIAHGADPKTAVRRTARRLAGPLAASSITTVFAFIPIAASPGAAGEFIGTMGLTVILSIIASYLVAMTLTSAMGGWFHGRPRRAEARRTWWRDGFNHPAMTTAYRRALGFFVNRPVFGVGVSFILPIIGFIGASTLPMQFFPPTERDQFQVKLELPPQASIQETLRWVDRADALLRGYDDVTGAFWVVGDRTPSVYYNVQSSGEGVLNKAAGFVNTKDAKATRRLLDDLQAKLMEAFPEGRARAIPYEQGPPVDAPVEVRIFGPDLDTLRRLGEDVRLRLDRVPSVTYAAPQLVGGVPKIRLDTDEEAAQLAGFTLAGLAQELATALEGGLGGSILENVQELPVRVVFATDARSRLDSIAGAPLLPASASRVGALGAPIEALSTLTLVPEIGEIVRIDGRRVNPVYGYLRAFELPATATAEFRAVLADDPVDLPAGYRIEFAGEEAERGAAVGMLLTFAAPLMVLMLGAVVLTFNSFQRAGVILLTAVLSVGLALFGVRLFGYPLGFTAIVGTLGLVGLAINGSIVVLSLLREDEAAREGDRDAIVRVAMGSTRHILSTTLTTVGGFFPLLLFGGTFWGPLATAIAGGVSGAAVLALVMTPSLHSAMTKRRALAA